MVGEGGSCGSGMLSAARLGLVPAFLEDDAVLLGGRWTDRGTDARSSSSRAAAAEEDDEEGKVEETEREEAERDD